MTRLKAEIETLELQTKLMAAKTESSMQFNTFSQLPKISARPREIEPRTSNSTRKSYTAKAEMLYLIYTPHDDLPTVSASLQHQQLNALSRQFETQNEAYIYEHCLSHQRNSYTFLIDNHVRLHSSQNASDTGNVYDMHLRLTAKHHLGVIRGTFHTEVNTHLPLCSTHNLLIKR